MEMIRLPYGRDHETVIYIYILIHLLRKKLLDYCCITYKSISNDEFKSVIMYSVVLIYVYIFVEIKFVLIPF